jgi:acyl-CoA thioester hydrolase
MKVVYHGKYLEYFEAGRAALIRSLGLPYSELEKRGILLPVVEAFAKYRIPALYDDLLSVEAVVSELPKATLRIYYRIFRDGEKEPLAEGYTVHSFLNVATGKPTRPPAYFLDVIRDGMIAASEPIRHT